jgi:triosephosphate isomerase
MLIVANWKMNLGVKEAGALAVEFVNLSTPRNQIVIAPQFTQLHKLADVLSDSKIKLSAQNCASENKGAFTGEVSPLSLKELGCEYVIIGHSERRTVFNETDEDVRKKALIAKNSGLKPIICIGESLEERKSGATNNVLSSQIEKSIPDELQVDEYVIAYEPIWAIGTGEVASIGDIEAAHIHINSLKPNVRILYGGSVNNENCKTISAIELVGGLLVGGASLSSEKFPTIMNV